MSCQYAKISCEEDKLKACCDSWIDEYIVLSILQKEGSRTRRYTQRNLRHKRS